LTCSPIARAASSSSCNCGLGKRNIGGIYKHSHTRGPWKEFAQKFHALCGYFGTEKIDACQIAAGPRKTGNKAKPDGIFGDENTMGIVVVCAFAASAVGIEIAAMTVTCRRTRSAATLPSDIRS